MRHRTAGPSPHESSPSLTIYFKHEANCAGNKSETETYLLKPEDVAIMVDTDRHQLAEQAGVPVDEVEPRHPQEIIDGLWNAEEAVNHEFHRGDRGPGGKTCTCGAGCEERRGCRLPTNEPWSFDQLVDEDREPTVFGQSPEELLIAAEDARRHETDLAAQRAAISTLEGTRRQVAELLAYEGLKQAEVARRLGLTPGRVSQVASGVKSFVREAVEQSRLNISGELGSGVRGLANRVGPRNKEGR